MAWLDIGEIRQIMNRISMSGQTILTNYYYNDLSGRFEVIQRKSTVIFTVNDGEVFRAYYYSSNQKELTECLKTLPLGTIIDIISKEKNVDMEWLNEAGFFPYATYGRFGRTLHTEREERERMSTNPLDRFFSDKYGEYAKKSDVAELQKIIYDTFDANSDHLLSDREMLELIEKKWVIIQRDRNQICCVFIYRIEGKKIYYNLSINKSTADVLYSIQKKALLSAISKWGVRYVYGWISLNNKQALKRNQYPMFEIYDYILQKKVEVVM